MSAQLTADTACADWTKAAWSSTCSYPRQLCPQTAIAVPLLPCPLRHAELSHPIIVIPPSDPPPSSSLKPKRTTHSMASSSNVLLRVEGMTCGYESMFSPSFPMAVYGSNLTSFPLTLDVHIGTPQRLRKYNRICAQHYGRRFGRARGTRRSEGLHYKYTINPRAGGTAG